MAKLLLVFPPCRYYGVSCRSPITHNDLGTWKLDEPVTQSRLRARVANYLDYLQRRSLSSSELPSPPACSWCNLPRQRQASVPRFAEPNCRWAGGVALPAGVLRYPAASPTLSRPYPHVPRPGRCWDTFGSSFHRHIPAPSSAGIGRVNAVTLPANLKSKLVADCGSPNLARFCLNRKPINPGWCSVHAIASRVDAVF